MWKAMLQGSQSLDEHTGQQLCSKGCHAASPIHIVSSYKEAHGGRGLNLHF